MRAENPFGSLLIANPVSSPPPGMYVRATYTEKRCGRLFAYVLWRGWATASTTPPLLKIPVWWRRAVLPALPCGVCVCVCACVCVCGVCVYVCLCVLRRQHHSPAPRWCLSLCLSVFSHCDHGGSQRGPHRGVTEDHHHTDGVTQRIPQDHCAASCWIFCVVNCPT